MVGNLAVFGRSLKESIGRLRAGLGDSQSCDLILRAN